MHVSELMVWLAICLAVLQCDWYRSYTVLTRGSEEVGPSLVGAVSIRWPVTIDGLTEIEDSTLRR